MTDPASILFPSTDIRVTRPPTVVEGRMAAERKSDASARKSPTIEETMQIEDDQEYQY